MQQKLVILWLALAGSPFVALGQAVEENFDNYGDADNEGRKSFCTQKVNYLSPTKLYGIGCEYQAPFDATTGVPTDAKGTLGPTYTNKVNRFSGLRIQTNTPLVSRSTYILNLGVTYWNTGVGMGTADNAAAANAIGFDRVLERGLRTAGVNLTLFKPLDDKRYILLQGNVDASGTYRNPSEVTSKNLTYSGTAIYGWKKNDNFLWGLGITRTYRAGQLLHIPVVLYNRTFNPRWGIEAIFPAKVNVRRSFGPSRLLMLGYEIEGNAYYLGTYEGQSPNTSQLAAGSDLFLRRGEVKPRLTYEQKLTGFIWLSVQAGVRIGYRFLTYTEQNPRGFAFGETDDVLKYQAVNTKLGAAPYVNLSINLVSP